MPPSAQQAATPCNPWHQLHSPADNSANRVLWPRRQQGLLFEPVEHHGNGSHSEEEVERIAALVQELIGCWRG